VETSPLAHKWNSMASDPNNSQEKDPNK